jgi:hypothetical protein
MNMSHDGALELNDAAERLAREFDSLPLTTVINTLTECAETWPAADAAFIEAAVRARLGNRA